MNKYLSNISTLIGLLILSPSAFSQPVMAFGVASNIPTLSGSMLIVLSLLMAIGGYFLIKKQENNPAQKMILSIVAMGVLTFGYSGIKLVSDAYAIAVSGTKDLTGSQITITYGWWEYQNKTGTTTIIKSITPPLEQVGSCNNAQPPGGLTNACAVGLSLGVDEKCEIFCTNAD
ncbi:MAG: midcut-by-XrtH protein [Pseudomonadota bacterium]